MMHRESVPCQGPLSSPSQTTYFGNRIRGALPRSEPRRRTGALPSGRGVSVSTYGRVGRQVGCAGNARSDNEVRGRA